MFQDDKKALFPCIFMAQDKNTVCHDENGFSRVMPGIQTWPTGSLELAELFPE